MDDGAWIPKFECAKSGSPVAVWRRIDIGPIRNNSRSLYGRTWPLQIVST